MRSYLRHHIFQLSYQWILIKFVFGSLHRNLLGTLISLSCRSTVIPYRNLTKCHKKCSSYINIQAHRLALSVSRCDIYSTKYERKRASMQCSIFRSQYVSVNSRFISEIINIINERCKIANNVFGKFLYCSGSLFTFVHLQEYLTQRKHYYSK